MHSLAGLALSSHIQKHEWNNCLLKTSLICVEMENDFLNRLFSLKGDLEVDRLLTEIDDAVKLLPYLMEKDKAALASQDIEQAVQPIKVENAQLRRYF